MASRVWRRWEWILGHLNWTSPLDSHGEVILRERRIEPLETFPLIEKDVGRVDREPLREFDEWLEGGERDFAVVEYVPDWFRPGLVSNSLLFLWHGKGGATWDYIRSEFW